MTTDRERDLFFGLLLAAVLTAALILWNTNAETSCEERGGTMVWEVNMAASSAYGECVVP